jgi:hypothetical protein
MSETIDNRLLPIVTLEPGGYRPREARMGSAAALMSEP